MLRVLPIVAQQASRWMWRPPRVAMSGPTWWARRISWLSWSADVRFTEAEGYGSSGSSDFTRDTLKVLYIAEGQCVNLLKIGFSISKSFFNQKMWILDFDEHMCVCQKVEIPSFFPSIFESQVSSFYPFSTQIPGFYPGQCGPGHCGLVIYRRHVVIDIDETTNLWIFMDIYMDDIISRI